MRVLDLDASQVWQYENGFHLLCDVSRTGKLLAHYELYKMASDLPGAVVECGVYKGSSLIQWATFRDLLENSGSRAIVGFDVFDDFPQPDHPADRVFLDRWNTSVEGVVMAKEDLEAVLAHKGLKNVTLVKGDINETVPRYVADNPHLKIALLHIDTDIYAPSKTALEHLYDHVVRGGVIVLDDYGAVYGETKAADEFFAGMDVRIRKLPLSHTVPSYLIKK